MSKFFISDLHLGHRMMASIRGFESVWEHDEHIIEAWNEVVTHPDWEVYLLGDISFHKSSVAAHLFNRLNGRIHLIEGNHDKKNLKSAYLKERFESIQDYLEIRPGFTEGRIILFHYPIISWRGMWHGTWHLLSWKTKEQSHEKGGYVLGVLEKACYLVGSGGKSL